MITAEELAYKWPTGYDQQGAAVVAGVHPNTIYYAIEHGHLLPFRSPTGTKKISAAELARWMNGRKASN